MGAYRIFGDAQKNRFFYAGPIPQNGTHPLANFMPNVHRLKQW